MKSEHEIKKFLSSINPHNLPDGEDFKEFLEREIFNIRHVIDILQHPDTRVYYYNYTTGEFFNVKPDVEAIRGYAINRRDGRIFDAQVQKDPYPVTLAFSAEFITNSSLVQMNPNYLLLHTWEQEDFYALYMDYDTEMLKQYDFSQKNYKDETQNPASEFGKICEKVSTWMRSQTGMDVTRLCFTMGDDGLVRADTTISQIILHKEDLEADGSLGADEEY